ncbi:hypothetical protein Tsubulata_049600 [Turnera subulata]|uniref:WD repeat-containing protein 44 n=1 Tax=Turnera subulata TaxID=218843 RepID=A0A9Q0IZ44_9ROSI|nr:hypothetical protein Tsubulata_049600 [Turnera subulata]
MPGLDEQSWSLDLKMGSLSGDEDRFFDTREDIASVSDSGSDSLENPEADFFDGISSSFGTLGYEDWDKNPDSIGERRSNFLRWMDLVDDLKASQGLGTVSSREPDLETDRITEQSGAVLGSSSSCDERFSSGQSSVSFCSSDAHELMDGTREEEYPVCRIRNLDNGAVFIFDGDGQDNLSGRIREVGSDRLFTVAEFERSLGLSTLVQRVMRRDDGEASSWSAVRKTVKMGWLRRLSVAACAVRREMEGARIKHIGSSTVARARNPVVRVKTYKKKSKELSALYMRQEIPAHEGSILTMKFSPDGQYLASGGQDGIVRVWKVMESERSDDFDILDRGTSYFAVNNQSQLVPLPLQREKKGKFRSPQTTSDSTCVIFPRKKFQISEKPVHEFYGHSGDILDLSWSKNKCLLSSSVDKTVRLWQVGRDECLQVFSHSNYGSNCSIVMPFYYAVTCVQFNPVDESYFVSGCLDGKVRIWTIPGCQVIDWTDMREIVTAVCFRPDGKGGVVGSFNGNCRFYNCSGMPFLIASNNWWLNWCILHGSDNRLLMHEQFCLKRKKKSISKRITGFQFFPSDPTRLMVTSADFKVRILHGEDVICKYRGIKSAGNQVSASFTSNGTHIVSASEDSSINVWNYINQDKSVPRVKKILSCERFFSKNTSVVIPWCGMASENSFSSSISDTSQCSEERRSPQSGLIERSHFRLPFSSPDRFSMSRRFFSDSLSKGSATWPEEELPPKPSTISSAKYKSQYKFLTKSCQSAHSSPHAWGLVIVTGGSDGRIRSFQNYGLPVRL